MGGDSDMCLLVVVLLQGDDSADTAGQLKRLVQTSPPSSPYTQPSQFTSESLHPSRFTSESLRPRVTAVLARHSKNRLPCAPTEMRMGGGAVTLM